MSRPFEAEYGGVCAADDCPAPEFGKGALVRYDASDQIVHAQCPAPPTICPGCFMALPVSGVCGTCD